MNAPEKQFAKLTPSLTGIHWETKHLLAVYKLGYLQGLEDISLLVYKTKNKSIVQLIEKLKMELIRDDNSHT
jgi:hypothetical protein